MLDRRLIFVTGKGGVGKSTVAHAIGRLGARQGKRVIVAELAPAGSGAGIDEVQLSPGLFSIVIDPQAAMEEYLRVKAGTLGGALSHSRLFSTLAMATPGLRELLGMGKIWELAQLQRRTRDGAVYDLVVVDAPATGHGVAALRTPRVFAQTARVGPIAYQADIIASTLADPDFTAIVAVSVAEEMPVRETLSLADALAADGLGLDRVVLNQVYPERFTPAELERIRAAAGGLDPTAEALRSLRSALAAALSAQARARSQQSHARELVDRFGERLAPLPFLFCDELGDAELDRLADLLEPKLTLP
ncbi:MAG TPA: ArsA family ATPase [Solirubrobacteraceae bacterium]|nr:ArsA family ATPase [Solirubrobacteraceae bacterium]